MRTEAKLWINAIEGETSFESPICNAEGFRGKYQSFAFAVSKMLLGSLCSPLASDPGAGMLQLFQVLQSFKQPACEPAALNNSGIKEENQQFAI